MRRLLFSIITVFVSVSSFSQTPAKENAKPDVLVITANIRDFKSGMGGTALMMKDTYKFHILICAEDGQCPEYKKKTENVAKMVNASVYFMKKTGKETDGTDEGIDRIDSLMKEVDPAIIFTLWGIESPEQAVVSTMARVAMYRTRMIYDRELYFFRSGCNGQTNQFEPDFYINISEVKAKKDELLNCEKDKKKRGLLLKDNEIQDSFYGKAALCSYAEPFRTYYPIINSRWGKKPHNSLLGLAPAGITKPDDNNKDVLIIGTHPDDWEIAMSGTATLMKDKYRLHVLILTEGEMGMGKENMEECAKTRIQQAIDGSKKINAPLHIMKFPDSKVTATKEMVDSIVYWANKVDPAIIFMHWPMEKPDHATAGNACLKALSVNGMINDREVYYFGVQQSTQKCFTPDLYVNISNVVEIKKELITMHDLPSHKKGELLESALEMNKYFGSINNCGYAEGFLLHNPMINFRGNNKTRYSLLEL
jgi:LmbE family N-acetylglucosaminyl deacetylase